MGLDMYLNRERHVQNWGHLQESMCEVSLKINGQDIPLTNVTTIIEQVGYWRKANAIHRWFCSLDGGRDKCQKISVEMDQLRELASLCQQVLADHAKAEALLPTTVECPFGGTDYDEHYFEDLRRTIELLTPLFSNTDNDSPCRRPYYYYEASW